jgi:hypothetical protein
MMSRLLLQYLLPLFLPMILYLVWTSLTRGRQGQLRALFAEGPWFWLVVAGFALMIAGLAVVAVIEGSSPDAEYVPPRFEDGRIEPGHAR